MFPDFRECAFVAGAPGHEAGLDLLATTRYNELGFAFPETLYVYAVRTPGCPM
jgi:hypothetical protein